MLPWEVRILHYFHRKSKMSKSHSVEITGTQCGNYGILLSHFFDKNFVKVTFLLNLIIIWWICLLDLSLYLRKYLAIFAHLFTQGPNMAVVGLCQISLNYSLKQTLFTNRGIVITNKCALLCPMSFCPNIVRYCVPCPFVRILCVTVSHIFH